MSEITMDDALAAYGSVLFETGKNLKYLEDRIRELEILRDELTRALNWYADVAEEMYYYGGSSGVLELCLDRGKRAKEAIAKAKGKRSVRPSPQGPDSFAVEATRAAIAEANGE